MSKMKKLEQQLRGALLYLGDTQYAGLLSDLDEMYRSGDRNYYRSAFFDSLSDEAIDAFVEKAAPWTDSFLQYFWGTQGRVIWLC